MEKIEVYVKSKTIVAHEVVDVVLTTRDGTLLPDAEPGAHIDVYLPGGVKHYSVHKHCRIDNTYSLGIGLNNPSRGGSEYIHGKLAEGDQLAISKPKNNFKLLDDADLYLFVAGGIGITPIISMIRWCLSNNKAWRLLYTVRERERAAYANELADLPAATLHVTDEVGHFADVGSFLGAKAGSTRLYCCGPGPLMEAVRVAAEGRLDKDHVHFELFAPPVESQEGQASASSFTLEISSTGDTFEVPADKSILDVLEQNGIEIPFSCREGLCRTCETVVLEGVVDHRDYVLDDQERESNTVILPCVSRCKGKKLKLEI